jgi:hypothetical protein
MSFEEGIIIRHLDNIAHYSLPSLTQYSLDFSSLSVSVSVSVFPRRLIFSSLSELTTYAYGALFSAVVIGNAAFSALINLDSLDSKEKKNIISDMQRVWGQEGARKKTRRPEKMYAIYTSPYTTPIWIQAKQ